MPMRSVHTQEETRPHLPRSVTIATSLASATLVWVDGFEASSAYATTERLKAKVMQQNWEPAKWDPRTRMPSYAARLRRGRASSNRLGLLCDG